MLNTALSWLERGIAPIPLVYRQKRPAVRWRVFQQTLPPPEMVKSWFSRQHNLGLVLSGGLVVLDFDDRDAYHHWQGPASYTVETSRGYHVYFWLADPPDRSFSLPGLDVKATGYVLAPPSVHPTGHVYVGNNAGIASLPDLAAAGVESEPPSHTRHGVEGAEPLRGVGRLDGSTGVLYYGVIADIKRQLSCLGLASRYTTMTPGPEGLWWLGRCPHPAHLDKHPSFRVDMVRDYATCLTPGCVLHEPKGLDVIELYSRLTGVGDKEAMRDLAGWLGLCG